VLDGEAPDEEAEAVLALEVRGHDGRVGPRQSGKAYGVVRIGGLARHAGDVRVQAS
jgi:hypothetical protein